MRRFWRKTRKAEEDEKDEERKRIESGRKLLVYVDEIAVAGNQADAQGRA